jgi:hypothetical protein
MSLLAAWMPDYDVAARYAVQIAAPPEQVWASLLATDFRRPRLVRILMGLRYLPTLLRSLRTSRRRIARPQRPPRGSLTNLDHSDFVLLEQHPPREIVLGISGRFWRLKPEILPIPAESFRAPLAAGLAQAAWNFSLTPTAQGAELATETRIHCADPISLRRFRRYWWLVSIGSGLIRRAILAQVRREAQARVRN